MQNARPFALTTWLRRDGSAAAAPASRALQNDVCYPPHPLAKTCTQEGGARSFKQLRSFSFVYRPQHAGTNVSRGNVHNAASGDSVIMKATFLVTVAICLFASVAGFINLKTILEISKDFAKCFRNTDCNAMRDRFIQVVPHCTKDTDEPIPCIMTKMKLTESQK
ncbi:hypothetical protein HPB47_016530, partial [Ixodes persulcatus]